MTYVRSVVAADLQAAALSDREVVVAVVGADHVAVDVDDLAGAFARRDAGLALDDRRVAILLRHEADLVRLLLSRHRQPASSAIVAHLRLRQLAEGKQRVAKLLLRQLEEEVRLVLRQMQRLAQLERPPSSRS